MMHTPSPKGNSPTTSLVATAASGSPLQEILNVLANILIVLQQILELLAGRTKSHYTVDEIAAMTGRAPYTVRQWAKKGLMEVTRVQGVGPRGRLLVPASELTRLVQAGRGLSIPAIAATSLPCQEADQA
jgi:hypothetical protein